MFVRLLPGLEIETFRRLMVPYAARPQRPIAYHPERQCSCSQFEMDPLRWGSEMGLIDWGPLVGEILGVRVSKAVVPTSTGNVPVVPLHEVRERF